MIFSQLKEFIGTELLAHLYSSGDQVEDSSNCCLSICSNHVTYHFKRYENNVAISRVSNIPMDE